MEVRLQYMSMINKSCIYCGICVAKKVFMGGLFTEKFKILIGI